MGDQVSGTRPAGGATGDQSAVLRKLAGRLDSLTTGEAPRLIRPGEAGYGDGPAMPHIDPEAYRAETGKEWVPTEAAAAATQPAPQAKAKPAQPQTSQGAKPQAKAKPQGGQAKAQPKAKGPQGKPKQQGQRPQQHGPQGKPKQQSQGPRPQQQARPSQGKQQAAKQPGFWARLWAKLTGKG